MSNLRLFFAIILILFEFSKCTTENPIPEVHVNLTIYLGDPLYADLNYVWNSVFVPNYGYKGLIITRTGLASSDGSEFKVYDASCTYNPNDLNSVVEIKEMSGVCKTCGSKFSLMINGMVEKGPASMPLKAYNVKYNQSAQTLYINNGSL